MTTTTKNAPARSCSSGEGLDNPTHQEAEGAVMPIMTDTSTPERRGWQLVDRTDGSPASEVMESREAAEQLLDQLPDHPTWDRVNFDVVECDPLPEGPNVPWATDVLIETSGLASAPFRAQASWMALDEHGLHIGVEQLFDFVNSQWLTYGVPVVFVSGFREYHTLRSVGDVARIAAALQDAADKLDEIRKAGGSK